MMTAAVFILTFTFKNINVTEQNFLECVHSHMSQITGQTGYTSEAESPLEPVKPTFTPKTTEVCLPAGLHTVCYVCKALLNFSQSAVYTLYSLLL